MQETWQAPGTRSAAVLAQSDPEAHPSGNTPGRSTPRRSTPGRNTFSRNGPPVQLVLKELPEQVAAALAGFDLDGDGTIDLSELHMGADAGARAVSKHHFYKRLFVILFGIWLAQLGSTFGVVFGCVAGAAPAAARADRKRSSERSRASSAPSAAASAPWL